MFWSPLTSCVFAERLAVGVRGEVIVIALTATENGDLYFSTNAYHNL